MFYLEMKNPRSERKGVVIYGAGEAGVITKRTIDRDMSSRSRVVAFIDDDPEKAGKAIENIPVAGTIADIPEKVREYNVEEILIAIPSAISPISRSKVISISCFAPQIRLADQSCQGVLDQTGTLLPRQFLAMICMVPVSA